MPVTIPVFVITATEALLDVQVPVPEKLKYVCPPIQIVEGPLKEIVGLLSTVMVFEASSKQEFAG